MIDKCYYVTVKDDGTLKDLAFKYSTAGIELGTVIVLSAL